jgi:hypothetical protein
MEFTPLKEASDFKDNKKYTDAVRQFNKLLEQLNQKDLPRETVEFINKEIEEINTSSLVGKELGKEIKSKHDNILKVLRNDLNIVPKHHYRNQWLALGMAAFGIPLGVAFGSSLDNMAYLGLGLPIGLAIGIAVGTGLDDKAKKEGRQLDYEIP